jgi:hypothetical protein
MKKLGFGLCCLFLIALCGCQKNDCQTFLQGSWIAVYPNDTSYISRDSVFFYQADSIKEFYKFHADTGYRIHYSSYFITDQCDEIDFNGTNTWDSIKKVLQYHILQVNGNILQIRSKADSSNCTPCIISFHR